MSEKLIKYLNKSKIDKKEAIKAILFSEKTYSYYYLFDIDMKNEDCIMMCEPIDSERPYCEMCSVYFDQIKDIIGDYIIVNGYSLGLPYKEVYKRLQKEEARLLKF